MEQGAHVPEFGNWDGKDDVPYTVYFDKARKGKTRGKMTNPNDPQENPDMFQNIASQSPASRSRTKPEEPIGHGAVKSTYERPASRENANHRQLNDSTAARNDNLGRRGSGEPTHQNSGNHGSSSGKPVTPSVGYNQIVDRSPLNPHHQRNFARTSRDSPSREGKNLYDSSSHGTHGKSRSKSTFGGVDRTAQVPKFGDWDPNDPSAAEEFTGIFDDVIKQRRNGSAATNLSPSNHTPRQIRNDRKKGCCFPWFGK